MSVSPRISRRSFVQAAGAATAGVGLSSVLGSARASAAITGIRSGSSPALDRVVADQLDQAIADTMVRLGIPGSIVGLWTPRGQYVKAFGISDRATRAPMQTDLYMRIGSNTKTFVAAAVLQLVDQGKSASATRSPHTSRTCPMVTASPSTSWAECRAASTPTAVTTSS